MESPNRSPEGVPPKYRPVFFLLAVAAIFCFGLVGQSLSVGHIGRAAFALVLGLGMVGLGFIWRGRLLR
ncbi:MAG: hypothetical protein QJR01_04855 [Kyrpidia sp.]|nr:hypothetical protein [Kyrpidia sp.]